MSATTNATGLHPHLSMEDVSIQDPAANSCQTSQFPSPFSTPSSIQEPGEEREVVVSNRSDKEIAADYMAAILESNDRSPWVFSRGDNFAYIRRDGGGRASFCDIGVEAMMYVMESSSTSKAIRLVTTKDERAKKAKKVPTSVPRRIASLLLHDVRSWLPPCQQISRSPGLRPDGTIYSTPGYDAAAKVYYDPASDFDLPDMPEAPTQEDARAAYATIAEILVDFPFSSQSDRANTLALALTLITRSSIDGLVPMACIAATSDKGTGKTFLAEILHLIATGEPPAAEALPEDDTEMRKTITSVIMGGQPFVLFDNVRGTVNLKSLEAALTSRVWTERLLGTNKLVKGEQKATWAMTGNGTMNLGGDLQRRCYMIHLDAHMSRAYLRGGVTQPYKYPFLAAHVLEHRGELLAALLTIARAWFVAGKPEAPLTMFAGSYPQWSRMMAGMLEYAGIEGFLATLEQDLDDQSEEEAQWEAFLKNAYEALGDSSWTAKALATACLPSVGPEVISLLDSMPDALIHERDKCHSDLAFQCKLGRFIRNRVGRRFGRSGVFVMKAGEDTRGGRALWRIVLEQPITAPTLVPEQTAMPSMMTMAVAPASAVSAHLEPVPTLPTAAPTAPPILVDVSSEAQQLLDLLPDVTSCTSGVLSPAQPSIRHAIQHYMDVGQPTLAVALPANKQGVLATKELTGTALFAMLRQILLHAEKTNKRKEADYVASFIRGLETLQ